MAFTFAAFCYIVALIFSAFLIFFAIWHIIAFDELKTDYKNPIDQVGRIRMYFSSTCDVLCRAILR